MTITVAEQSVGDLRPEYTDGYAFAKAYMRCIAIENELQFEPKNNYEIDNEYYHMAMLEGATIRFLLLQKQYYLQITSQYPSINTSSQFRDFCVRLCPLVFYTGYSSMNFLNFLCWVTRWAVDFKKTFSRDYLLDAFLIIGDVLDIFMENKEFEFGGSWEDLYNTAETLDRSIVIDHLRIQSRLKHGINFLDIELTSVSEATSELTSASEVTSELTSVSEVTSELTSVSEVTSELERLIRQ